MAINLQSSEGIVKRAIQLACQNNPEGALQLLQPLGLSAAQNGAIAAIFEEARNSTDAPNLQKRVLSILYRNNRKDREFGKEALQNFDAERATIAETQVNSPAEIIKYSLLDIPPEDLFKILSTLDWKDIPRCAQVCKYLYQTTQDKILWQEVYYHNFHTYYPKQDLTLDFYQACKDSYKSQLNFLSGVYAKSIIRTQRGVSSLVFSGGMLYFGFFGGEIQIWDLKTLKCVNNFQGHQDGVHFLAVFDGKLCSGSYDDTIKIWDLKTGACLNTLECQESISSLFLFDGKLYAGSYAGPIKIWDLKMGTHLDPLQGHTGIVYALAMFNGKLYSSSSDGTIKVWCLKTGKCLKTLQGYNSAAIYSLFIFDGKLYSGSSKGLIQVWDLGTEQWIGALQGHEAGIFSLAFFDGRLCSGSYDGRIKIWDLKTEECLNIPCGYRENASPFATFDGQLCSGSLDDGIMILDFAGEHPVIFTEIANLFRSGNKDANIEAIGRFARMPNEAKNKVYAELNRILPSHDIGERAWLNATPEQKAEAIEGYLAT